MPASARPTSPSERLILLTLAAVQFTHIMDFMIMMPLGSHLMRVFSITPAQFGRLVAAYGLAAALFGFLAGFVLDRLDRKRALLTLYSGFGLATLACALAPNYPALLAARFTAGAFGGVAGSVVGAIVGDVVPPERRGRGMGMVMTAFPLASVLGLPVGLALASRFEWHAPFFLLAALSIIILITASRVLPPLRDHSSTAHPWQQMREILTHPVHRRGFLLSGVLVFAGGCVIPFMAPSMVANVGLTEAQLPLIYMAGGLATLFTTNLIGRLSDRYDKIYVLGVLSLAACVATLFITRLPRVSLPMALTVTTLFMVAMSGRFAPAMAMVVNSVDARYRGGFMSVNSAIQQASGGLANIVAGLLIASDPAGRLTGYPSVGVMSVLFFLLAVYLAYRLRAIAPHASLPGAQPPVPCNS